MVCLTAERGWNTEGGNDFQNKETGSRSRNRSTSLRLLSHYFKLLYWVMRQTWNMNMSWSRSERRVLLQDRIIMQRRGCLFATSSATCSQQPSGPTQCPCCQSDKSTMVVSMALVPSTLGCLTDVLVCPVRNINDLGQTPGQETERWAAGASFFWYFISLIKCYFNICFGCADLLLNFLWWMRITVCRNVFKTHFLATLPICKMEFPDFLLGLHHC